MLTRENTTRTLRRSVIAFVAFAILAMNVTDLAAQAPYYEQQQHFPRSARSPLRGARALPANPFPAVYADPPAPIDRFARENPVRYAALNKTFSGSNSGIVRTNGTAQDVFGENPMSDIFKEEKPDTGDPFKKVVPTGPRQGSRQELPPNPFGEIDPEPDTGSQSPFGVLQDPAPSTPPIGSQSPFGVLQDPAPSTPPMDTRPLAPQNNDPKLPPGFEFTPNPNTIPSRPPVPGQEDPPNLEGPIELPEVEEADPGEISENDTEEDVENEDPGDSVFDAVDPPDDEDLPVPQPASSRVYLPAKTPSDYENGSDRQRGAVPPGYEAWLAAQNPYAGLPGPYGYSAPPQGFMPYPMPPHMMAQFNPYAYGYGHGPSYGQCGPGCQPIGGQCGPGCRPIDQEKNRCGLLSDPCTIATHGGCNDCDTCSNTSRPTLPQTRIGERIVETGCVDTCGDCGDDNDTYTDVVSDCDNFCSNYASCYVSLFGGWSSVNDFITRGDVGNGVYFDDSGYMFGFAIGQIQGRNLRTELELSYRSIDINGLRLENDMSSQFLAVNGDFGTFSGMLNGYWEFVDVPFEKVKPYIGGGLGFAIARPEFLQGDGVEAVIDNNDSSFAYQWMAGLNYKASSTIDAFVEYRYFVANSFNLETEIPTVDGLGNGSGQFNYHSRNVIFGLRARF